MTKPWRSLAAAAALSASFGVGTGAAQTVMARQVPAGERVEVMLNGKPVGSATADASGDATIPFNMQASLGKAEIDANVYVDRCDKTHRIWIVETSGPAPGEGTCGLRNISGVYWVRPVNTLVVNNTTASLPSLLLIKGSYTPPEPGQPSQASRAGRVPGGLIVFGGAGLVGSGSATSVACGNLADCSGDESGIGFTGGAEYRINRVLSVEGSYVRPPAAKASGTGDIYRFTSTRKTDVFTVAGKIGVPAGVAKVYARIGTIYHQAKFDTSQTHDARTVTVNDVPQTIPGGTQQFALKTDGWSWQFGGGLEVWVSSRVAIYGEVDYGALKGSDVRGGEGAIDDHLKSAVMGLRIHIGR